MQPDPKRVAAHFQAICLFRQAESQLASMDEAARVATQGRVKTAGEVIHKKDRSGDEHQWAYADIGPSERLIGDFNYSPKNLKPVARTLRATLAGLGHVLSAYNTFAKVKSARVSPDGSLGGKGFIQKIADMRRQFMNCVEALSALTDTLYDEVNAPHWSVLSRQKDPETKAEVAELIADVEDIRSDPEDWAEEQIEEEFENDGGTNKTASRLATRWLEAR